MTEGVPRGVWVPAAFFVGGGILELALAAWESPRPPRFWPLWEALGRAIFHFLLAAALWRRIALGRSIAMVYCLAVVPTYAAALALAWADAPLRFPPSIVIHSLYEVPSCLLLFPFLRSAEASQLFARPLVGR
jgi:hypothetical protein